MQIAVVGASQVLALTMARFLEEIGHEAQTFSDLAALELAAGRFQQYPDIVVIDQNCIGQSERMKPLHHARAVLNQPLVAVILEGHPPLAQAAREAGIFGYLASPPRLAEMELLLHRMEEYIVIQKGETARS